MNGVNNSANPLFLSTPTAGGGDSNFNFQKRLGLGSNKPLNMPGSFMGQNGCYKQELMGKHLGNFSQMNLAA